MNQLTLVEESPSAGARHVVAASATIGREGCEIVFDDPEVSRTHARINVLGNSPTIEDLGSTNGTLVNGQRLTGVAELKHGDVIKIGKAVLRIDAEVQAGATRVAAAQVPPAQPPAPTAATPQPPTAEPTAPSPAVPAQAPPPPPQAPAPQPPPPQTAQQPAATPPAPPAAEQAAPFGQARGDVPPPEPASASRVHKALSPVASPPKHAFDAGDTGGTRRGSAATRLEATVICYGIVSATAAGVIAYVLAEKL